MMLKIQLLDAAAWLRRTAGDVITGLAVFMALAAVIMLASAAISVVVQGPDWARWVVLTPVFLAVLTAVGRTWRREFSRQAERTIRADVRKIHDQIDRAENRMTRSVEGALRDAAEAHNRTSVGPLGPYGVAMDDRMASRSDDELRAQGVQDPAKMRHLGFMRYCAAAARAEERGADRRRDRT